MNEQIIQFLKELRVNNHREWFHANKVRYDALRQGFMDEVQELIHRIGLFDPEVAGLDAKDCLFRIYRDIRFSPDKTPYKCHFQLLKTLKMLQKSAYTEVFHIINNTYYYY